MADHDHPAPPAAAFESPFASSASNKPSAVFGRLNTNMFDGSPRGNQLAPGAHAEEPSADLSPPQVDLDGSQLPPAEDQRQPPPPPAFAARSFSSDEGLRAGAVERSEAAQSKKLDDEEGKGKHAPLERPPLDPLDLDAFPPASEIERMEKEQRERVEERERQSSKHRISDHEIGIESLPTNHAVPTMNVDVVPENVETQEQLRKLSDTIEEQTRLDVIEREKQRVLAMKGMGSRPGSAAVGAGKKLKKPRRPSSNEQKSLEERRKRQQAIEVVHSDPAVQHLRAFLKKKYGNMVRAWYVMDKDGNGALSQSEFSELLRKIGYPGALFTLWKKLDLDHNGRITFDAFEPWGARQIKEFRERAELLFGDLEDFFESLDEDHNGRISEKEFVQGLSQKLGYPEQQARQIYAYLDVSKQGIILSDVDPGVKKELDMGQGQVTLEMRVEMKKQEQLDLIERVQRRQAKNILYSNAASQPDGELGAFRSFLKLKFGSVIVAWRHFDRDNSGRISFREFTRGCREVGYFLNLRQLWVAFDAENTGFITIDALDSKGDGRVLAEFCANIVGGGGGMNVKHYEDVGKAWKLHFVREQPLCRLSEQTFVDLSLPFFPGSGRGSRAAEADASAPSSARPATAPAPSKIKSRVPELNPPAPAASGTADHPDGGDPAAPITPQNATAAKAEELIRRVFRVLDYDRTRWMTREKFLMLDLYHDKTEAGQNLLQLEEQAKKFASRKSIQDIVQSRNHTTVEMARKKRQRALEAKNEVLQLYADFKASLLARFGNMVRAWQFLDKDKSGRVSYTEFAKACLDMGFRGRLKELFRHIDEDLTGMVSFQEFAPEVYEVFEEFFQYLRYIKKNISKAEFLAGCQRLNYTDNAKLCDPLTLFDWLDTDNSGQLNFESEIAWLEKQQIVKSFAELQEERGQYKLSGRYKLPTGNSMLWQQLKWRERRLAISMGFVPPAHGIGALPQNPKFFTTLKKAEDDKGAKDEQEGRKNEKGEESPTKKALALASSSRPGTAPPGLLSLRAMREEQKRRQREEEEAEKWKNQVYDRVESYSPLELKEVLDRATALPVVNWTLDGERAVIRRTRVRPTTAIEEKAHTVAREERRLARIYQTPAPDARPKSQPAAGAPKAKGLSILKKKLG
eukprot:g4110.t1